MSNLAAIDIGTNSFHLVVVKTDEHGNFEIVGREKESVRLGSGAGDLETIQPDAMERGITVLARFSKIARTMNATVRAVATSAVREAKNKDEFLDRVRTECGIETEVIPGHEEARLIYMGMLQALPLYNRKILMIDIGGGSTEFLIGFEGRPLYAISVKLGAIRLKERFFKKEPLTKGMIDDCRKFIRIQLTGVRDEIRSRGFELAIGSSGTIETLAGMKYLDESDQGDSKRRDLFITRAELDEAAEKILSIETARKRSRLPGLDEKRADIIVGGVILLQEAFQLLGIENMQVSPYALREGVIYDTMSREQHSAASLNDIRRSSVEHLLESFDRKGLPGAGSARHSAMLSLKFFGHMRKLGLIPEMDDSDSFLLESAVMLHNIGLIISHSAHHKHSYYIIKNSELLLGFSAQEIEIIALLARYHRKSGPSKKHPEFTSLPPLIQRKILIMVSILRIIVGLDRSGTGNIRDLILTQEKKGLICDVIPSQAAGAAADISLEIWAAGLKTDLFEKTFGREIEFRKMIAP